MEYASYYTETGQFSMAYASYMRAADYCHGEAARDNCLKRAQVVIFLEHSSSSDVRDAVEMVANTKSGATVGERATADAYVGLVLLREGRFDKAADHLIRVNSDLREDVGMVSSPNDVALAAVLCSLATMSRR